MQHRAIAGIEIGRNDQHVIAGCEGFDRGPADILSVDARQPCHVEGVGHDHPFESHFLFEQSLHNRPGGRGHPVGLGIKSGNGDVRHHHGIHSRLNRAPEWRQLNRIQARPVARDFSQAKMRIGSGVAVSGKVFGRGQHEALVGAPNVRRHEIAHLLRVFSERARVNDGIRRVGIHVGHGKEIPMHSDGPRLQPGDASKGFGIFRFAGSSKSHRMGKNSSAIQPHRHAALKICRDNKGQLGGFLQPVEQLGSDIGLALEQDGTLHRDAHD